MFFKKKSNEELENEYKKLQSMKSEKQKRYDLETKVAKEKRALKDLKYKTSVVGKVASRVASVATDPKNKTRLKKTGGYLNRVANNFEKMEGRGSKDSSSKKKDPLGFMY